MKVAVFGMAVFVFVALLDLFPTIKNIYCTVCVK